MNNKTLFKISLSIALLGILILFIYSETITIKIKDISQIKKTEIDKTVKIIGQVTRVTDLPGLLIFNIKDKTSSIKIIVWKEDSIDIKQNDLLEIQGKIVEYQGELEIQAEKIIKK